MGGNVDRMSPGKLDRRVLIADDDQDFSDSLADLLRSHGFIVEILMFLSLK